MNGIEQQAMPIQALSLLHVQGIHSVISASRSGFRGGVRGVRPPKIRKAYVIQR
jgi:hypothetical protein